MSHALSVEDIAILWKVHPETVRLLIRSGRLPAFRVGRHWRVRPEDLEEFQRGRKDPSNT